MPERANCAERHGDQARYLYNAFPPQNRGPLCMKQPDETQGRRSRRRPSSADVSHAVFDRTRSYRHLRNPFVPLKVFSDDQVSAIHDTALVMLETQGMKVLSPDARNLCPIAGADADELTYTA